MTKNEDEKEKNESSKKDIDLKKYQARVVAGGTIKGMGFLRMQRADGACFMITMDTAQLRGHAHSCEDLIRELEGEEDQIKIPDSRRKKRKTRKLPMMGPHWKADNKPGKINPSHRIAMGTIEELSERLDEDLAKIYNGDGDTLSIDIKEKKIPEIKTKNGKIERNIFLKVLENIQGKRIRDEKGGVGVVKDEFVGEKFEVQIKHGGDEHPLLVEGNEDTIYLVGLKKDE